MTRAVFSSVAVGARSLEPACSRKRLRQMPSSASHVPAISAASSPRGFSRGRKSNDPTLGGELVNTAWPRLAQPTSDDGCKLRTHREIHRRLKPDARFVVVDLCIDLAAPDVNTRLDRYAQFALTAGADPVDVAETRTRLVDALKLVSPEREVELLRRAGFDNVDLLHGGLSWRGWSAAVSRQ